MSSYDKTEEIERELNNVLLEVLNNTSGDQYHAMQFFNRALKKTLKRSELLLELSGEDLNFFNLVNNVSKSKNSRG